MRLRGLGDRDCWFSVLNRGLQQGYQANTSTTACLLDALGPFACDLDLCPLPFVTNTAAEVCVAFVTEVAASAVDTMTCGGEYHVGAVTAACSLGILVPFTSRGRTPRTLLADSAT